MQEVGLAGRVPRQSREDARSAGWRFGTSHVPRQSHEDARSAGLLIGTSRAGLASLAGRTIE